MSKQRLYGFEGDERLHFTVEALTDAQELVDTRPLECVVEEWSVHPPAYHLPSANDIVHWIFEQVCEAEIDEFAADQWGEAADKPDVLAAAEVLRVAMAAHVGYRMANERVATHVLTWGEDGEPVLDGKALSSEVTA